MHSVRSLRRRWDRLVAITHTEAHTQHFLAIVLLYRALELHYGGEWVSRHRQQLHRAIRRLEGMHNEDHAHHLRGPACRLRHDRP